MGKSLAIKASPQIGIVVVSWPCLLLFSCSYKASSRQSPRELMNTHLLS